MHKKKHLKRMRQERASTLVKNLQMKEDPSGIPSPTRNRDDKSQSFECGKDLSE